MGSFLETVRLSSPNNHPNMSEALSGEWDGDSGVVFGTDAWISHVVGSSPQKAPSGYNSWMAYWCGKSGRQWPATCQIKGCSNPPSLGAHIYIKKQGLQQNFILPTCGACNQDTRYFYGNGYCQPNSGSLAVWIDRHPNTI